MNPRDCVEADPFLYFSGLRGPGPDGRFSSDTHEQAAAAFDTLANLLRERGLTMRHVVKVTMFMGDLAYRDPIHEIWLRVFPEDPPARVSFQIADAGVEPGDGAQFVLDVIALARPEALAGRRTVNGPEGGTRHMTGMVNATQGGGMIFFSAIRGRDAVTKKFTDDTRTQARQAFENLKTILEYEGGSLADIVKVTLYMNDVAYRNPFHEVWKEYFPENPPARTAVGVVNASASPRGKPHFVLDVTAIARS